MNSKYIDVSGLDDATVLYYYEELKKNIQNLVYYLSCSRDSLNGIDGVLLKYYSIDDNNVSSMSVQSVYENLRDRISYLNNTIIPSIDSKINSLK